MWGSEWISGNLDCSYFSSNTSIGFHIFRYVSKKLLSFLAKYLRKASSLIMLNNNTRSKNRLYPENDFNNALRTRKPIIGEEKGVNEFALSLCISYVSYNPTKQLCKLVQPRKWKITHAIFFKDRRKFDTCDNAVFWWSRGGLGAIS